IIKFVQGVTKLADDLIGLVFDAQVVQVVGKAASHEELHGKIINPLGTTARIASLSAEVALHHEVSDSQGHDPQKIFCADICAPVLPKTIFNAMFELLPKTFHGKNWNPFQRGGV